MNNKKLRFLRNIAIGTVFILPVVLLAVLVYNPGERAAIKIDKDNQGTVGYMGSMVQGSLLAGQEVPYESDGPNCGGEGRFCYISSGTDYIVYTMASSLSWKEYCNQKSTYILYSSVDNYNGLVCDDPPKVGKQKFTNN